MEEINKQQQIFLSEYCPQEINSREIHLHLTLFWWNLFSILQLSLQPIMKKALFLPFLRSLSITYFVNLESGKKTVVLEKSLEKVLIFGSKSSMNPDFKIMWHFRCHAVAVVNAKAPSYGWTGVCSINQAKMPYSNAAANNYICSN